MISNFISNFSSIPAGAQSIAAIVPGGWLTLGALAAASFLTVRGIWTHCCKKALRRIGLRGSLEDDIKRALEDCNFSEFVSEDALSFPGNIEPSKEVDVRERYLAWNDRKESINDATEQAAGVSAAQKEYTLQQIFRVGQIIEEKRSGVCATLALAAARRLILAKADRNSRSKYPHLSRKHIQLITYKNHTFVYVGRRRQDPLISLDSNGKPTILSYDLTHRRDSLYIIDPWAAAMGHGRGVYTIDTYPKSFLSFLVDTELCFDTRNLKNVKKSDLIALDERVRESILREKEALSEINPEEAYQARSGRSIIPSFESGAGAAQGLLARAIRQRATIQQPNESHEEKRSLLESIQ